MSRKEQFMNSFARDYPHSKIVVAIKLPTGATEIIINTDNIKSKFEYYCSAYDDDMRLRSNNAIQIINWMFV